MRKYLIAAALGVGSLATAGTAAATLAGAQTTPTPSNPTPSTTAPAATGPAAGAATKPDPATRIKEVLDPLVKDGTLTQAQADKVATALQNSMPVGGGKGGRGGKGGGLADAATVIGIDAGTLRTEVNGKTLAQVAEAHGKSRQQLIDGLVKAENARIDTAVTEGKLTKEQADARKATVVDRVTKQVDETRTAGGRGPGGATGSTSAAPTTAAPTTAAPTTAAP